MAKLGADVLRGLGEARGQLRRQAAGRAGNALPGLRAGGQSVPGQEGVARGRAFQPPEIRHGGVRRGPQLGYGRLLTVHGAVHVVDHAAHGEDHRRRGRGRPGQQRALIVEAAAQAGDRVRTRGQPVAHLTGRCQALGGQPSRQDAALGGGDPLQVGELLLDAQQVDVGGPEIAAQECLVGPQLELALAQAFALGARLDGAGFICQPHAVAPGPDDELPQRPRARVGVQLGGLVDGAEARPRLQQRQPLVQRVELPGDRGRALAVQVDGLLRPIAQLLQLAQPQAGRIGLQAVDRRRRLLRDERDLTIELAHLVREEAGTILCAGQARASGVGVEAGLAQRRHGDTGRLEVALLLVQPCRPPGRLPAGRAVLPVADPNSAPAGP